MNRFSLAILLVLSAFAARPALADAQLRSNVVVDGDVVRLSDLFDNAGDKADTAIARAPAPGKRVAVDAEWLGRIARAYGVAWHPASAFDQAVIERSGVTIGHEQMEQELLAALTTQGIAANSEIELVNRAAMLTVPVGVPTTVGVRDLTYDARYKRFTATIEVPADSPSAQRLRLSGRVFSTIEVPVLAHAVNRGDVIAARDLTWTKIRDETLRHDILTDADQVIGLTPRQPLRSGQMIASADLQKPVAVAKGALVTMVLKYGAMSLTAQGRAVEQGSVGDQIRIINTHSNLTVEGKVEGNNMVSVMPTGAVALAN